VFKAATLTLTPVLAFASRHTAFHLAFPAPPTLAVVQTGIQVVVDGNEEVFYTDNHYWVHRGDGWYHASHHDDALTYVDVQYVPPRWWGSPLATIGITTPLAPTVTTTVMAMLAATITALGTTTGTAATAAAATDPVSSPLTG
jgi:hypothetical protein